MAHLHFFAAVICISFYLFASVTTQTDPTAGSATGQYDNYTDFNATEGPLTCEPACVGGQCIVVDDEAYCVCERGNMLLSDGYTCQECPGGLYGVNCSSTCNCGMGGNTCDKVNGTCSCNMCYGGDSCEDSEGFECYVQFLANPDKNFNSLRESYGSLGYPLVPEIYERALIYSLAEISDINRDIISDVSFTPKSREEVNQGPLLQLKTTLDRSQGSSAVDSALTRLQDKVKVGSIAATLIIQDSLNTNTAEVTLNAGIKTES